MHVLAEERKDQEQRAEGSSRFPQPSIGSQENAALWRV
jgi:hypothetical protein